MRKTFAIGDIHGMLHQFEALLDRLSIAKDDRIILLGDYIDRGHNSRGVIEKILHLKKAGHNVIALKGNHEAMLLKTLDGKDPHDELLWIVNGGRSTMESYHNRMPPPEHMDFFRNLLLYYETDSYFFVHAGVEPGVPLPQENEEILLWTRREFLASPYDWGKKIVFGHTPLSNPAILRNKIGIDTGCVYGGKLTCLILPGETFISV